MDLQEFYYGELVRNFDLLSINKNAMVGLAELSLATLGSGVSLHGLAVTAGSGLTVSVARGHIYQAGPAIATAMGGGTLGGLPVDSHSIIKQGISLDPQVISGFAAPTTPGQSINYLVEVQYQDQESTPTVLPYFNAGNPQAQWAGPGNTTPPVSQSYVRKGVVGVQIKAGAAATTGSQTTPAPDSGWTGLAVVTVAYGATSLNSGNIAVSGNPPFIPNSLQDIPGNEQNGKWVAGNDTGTANHYVFNPPAPGIFTSNVPGQRVRVQFANANTGASDFSTSGLPAAPIRLSDGSALLANYILAGMWGDLTYDSAGHWQLETPSPYAWLKNSDYGTDSGTTNTFVITTPYAVSAYFDGMPVSFRAAGSTTGASTITVNGVGAVAAVRNDGSPLQRDDVKAGDDVFARYSSAISSFEVLDLAPNSVQYQTGNSGNAGGTANAITVTLSPAPTSQAILLGVPIRVKIATVNTGPATLNPNGIGAQPIVTASGVALGGNELQPNLYTEFMWTGSAYKIMSGAGAFAFQIVGDANFTIAGADNATVAIKTVFTAPRVGALPAANSLPKGSKITIADFVAAITAINTLTLQAAGADTINQLSAAVISRGDRQFTITTDGVSQWSLDSASQAPILQWTYVAASQSLPPGFYLVDTSLGPITITLENPPLLGDNYTFQDKANSFAQNNLILNANGLTIMGSASNFLCDVSGLMCTLSEQSGNWSLS